MNKFVKTSIIAGSTIVGLSSMSFAAFNDMTEHPETYLPAINYLSENGIINGYADNNFKPTNKIKRAEFAKIISLAENLKLKENNIKKFEDSNEHWALEFIDLAASNGLLKGYEDNTFKPEKEITYGELATIMLRTLGIYEVAEENVNWPDDYMKMANQLGLFDGVATNDLIGSNPARRDNVALVVYNTIQYKKQLIENENNQNSEVEKEEIIEEKIDTKKLYFGTVEMHTEKRGTNYITVKDFGGNEQEIKVNVGKEIPALHSLILYKLSSKGAVRLEKLLTIEDLNNDYLLVEKVEENIAKIKDLDELFDIERDTFEYDNQTIKFKRYDFYLANMIENDDGKYEFDDFEVVERYDVKLKKEDRIIFDYDEKMMFIIRGVEE